MREKSGSDHYSLMALFRTRSAAVYGIDAYLVDVEVDMYPGTSGNFITVGMPHILRLF